LVRFDASRFVDCAESLEKVARIEEDLEAGVGLELTSVPSLILEGTLLRAAPDSSALSAIVRGLLKEGT